MISADIKTDVKQKNKRTDKLVFEFLAVVLFWMLWMLVTGHKLGHVPQVSQITT